ncbi:hypothetical protein QCA50_004406 [Cerrena zonata]|uniref:Uncharacterized protein n=1 Tax=Cerrena zonata TaxID=2478898 RepID=A0AAW0GGQ6_9APHY
MDSIDFSSPLAEEALNQLTEQGFDLISSILDRAPFQDIVNKIKEGAPVWFQDDEGLSPLHAAAYTENAELVKYLLEEGAVWNAVQEMLLYL